MRWLKLIWSTTWGKIVMVSATIVIVVSGGIAVNYGQLLYVLSPQGHTSPTKQSVIIFVGGMNTTNSSGTSLICNVGTFNDLAHLLSNDLHVVDPYASHCPATVSMKNSAVNFAYFSYMGGSLNPNTGVWDPAPYNACDPDTIPLKQDVSTFTRMLQAYRSFYPNAHFTIVAHSLGGLVALEGASAFTAQFGGGIIDKLITVDSPLQGVPATYIDNKCEYIGGPILFDLNKVFNTPHLADTMVSQLEGMGTSVYTLGNMDDCLYQNLVTCKVLGWSLNNPQTQFVSGAYVHKYTLPAGSGPFAGHGTILSPNNANSLTDLVRYILAPHVTITEPKTNDVAWFDSTSTPLSYSVTVRCDWGAANRATAMLDVEGNNPYFVGSSVPTSQDNVLSLNGTVMLPADTGGPQATFYVNAGAAACQYPQSISSATMPSDSDYLGGESNGIPISIDGGKIAVGFAGQVHLAKRSGGLPLNRMLDYSSYNQSSTANSIQSVAWSHDGTRLAYLVQTTISYSSTTLASSTLSDLYVASSSLTNPIKLTANVTNAVALTWNATDDKIAILEEAEGHNGEGPGGYYFTPSIVIVDANTGVGRQHITMPASTTMFLYECGIECFPYRARFQWGSNGSFFFSYDYQGNTLVTPAGKAIPIDSQNGSPLGAMNAQGTMIVYPAIPANNTGPVSINLVSIDSSSGQPGSPTTLATLPQDSSGYQSAELSVDISPDGTQAGVCNGPDVYIIDIHHPNTIRNLASLPAQNDSTYLRCEGVQWTPDGQSLLITVAEYGDNASALAILPLNGAKPSVLFGCDISYTTSFQINSNSTSICNDYSVYDMQPLIQSKSQASSPPAEQANNAKLLAQSGTIHVGAGDQFDVYFDYENTGKSNWTDAGDYSLGCDRYYMTSSQCMGGTAQGLGGAEILPGGQATFYMTLTAPTRPGTYQTAWDMHDKNGIFGQNHVYVTIDVTASAPQTQPSPTPIVGLSPFVGEWWIAQGAIVLNIQPNGSATYTAGNDISTIQFTSVNGNTAYGKVTGGSGISLSPTQEDVIPVGGSITVTLLDSSDVQVSGSWQLCKYPEECAY
jgi:pimeloyl-ACP methyl ester carboxylesterase